MTTYKVMGATAYGGHAPGEEFDDELDELTERRAVARGAIRVVRRGDSDDDKTTRGKEDE